MRAQRPGSLHVLVVIADATGAAAVQGVLARAGHTADVVGDATVATARLVTTCAFDAVLCEDDAVAAEVLRRVRRLDIDVPVVVRPPGVQGGAIDLETLAEALAAAIHRDVSAEGRQSPE